MAERKTPAEEAADLRGAVREAHEAMKDLRRLLREVREVRAEVERAATRVFEEKIEEQAAAVLAEYHAKVGQAIEDATEAVDRRFDTIASILLGEDEASVRRDQPRIRDYAEAIASLRKTNPTPSQEENP